MKVLIATPCGGGLMTTQYFQSITALLEAVNKSRRLQQDNAAAAAYKGAIAEGKTGPEAEAAGQAAFTLAFEQGLHVGVQTLSNESLIPRGRNYCAGTALKQGWDKIFFIDSDCGFTPLDFQKIINSPSPLVGGACPLKIYTQNAAGLNLHLNYLPFKDDGEKYHPQGYKTIDAMLAMRRGHGTPEVPVAFLGTAFLCIDVSILKKLCETTKSYEYPNPSTGQSETYWDFFNCSPVNDTYMSEDWGFCDKARNHGYSVMLHTEVLVTHTGSHTFEGILEIPPAQSNMLQKMDIPAPTPAKAPPLEIQAVEGVI